MALQTFSARRRTCYHVLSSLGIRKLSLESYEQVLLWTSEELMVALLVPSVYVV